MRTLFLRIKSRPLAAAWTAALGLALLLLLLSVLWPRISASRYAEKSLALLRHNARLVRNQFDGILTALDRRWKTLETLSWPSEVSAVWSSLRKAELDKDIEGLAFHDAQGGLVAWLGLIVDLEPFLTNPESGLPPAGSPPFLLVDKASTFLVAVHEVAGGGRLVLTRLLAFTPRFHSPYLEPYQFVPASLRSGCEVDYWGFREDVSGFERLFGRHEDEYIGQPRASDDVPSLIFPLRGRGGRIVATVSLSAPSQRDYISAAREKWLLAFYAASLLFLVLLIIHLGRLVFSPAHRNPLHVLAFLLTVAAIRLIVFPLSQLEKIGSLDVFSPASSSFFSVAGLTRSPADIALSGLALLTTLLVLAQTAKKYFKSRPRNIPWPWAASGGAAAALAAFCLASLLLLTLEKLVANSSLNLLRFSTRPSFIALHLGLLAFVLSFYLATVPIVHAMAFVRVRRIPFFVGFAAGAALFYVLFTPAGLAGALVLLACGVSLFPGSWRATKVLFVGLLLTTLWICLALNLGTGRRERLLVQGPLKNTVLAQEEWAGFFLAQSFPELDKGAAQLLGYLKNPQDPDLARTLWERTVVAKFNWYSSLEILGPDGEVLSRFSLNVPKIYHTSSSLARTADWLIYSTTIPFLGKDKEFLVGAKDWFDGQEYLGRTVFSVSMDYEMLPFLYSANPYFELLRPHALPSLHQFDFRFVVYGRDGRIVFNPHRVSAGIGAEVLSRLENIPQGFWTSLVDRNAAFQAFLFASGEKAYALLLPRKTALMRAVEFLKLFFVYLAALAITAAAAAALFRPLRLKNYFWSFSNRVYAAFVAVALIPLLLFTLSARNFFGRVFSQQFAQTAEIHAGFARNVMEDYFYFQQEERRTPLAPPEDLVLWISTTIGNDVNLYEGGRLVFSSRREFFDAGLLPEIIDGDVYHSLTVARNPFATLRRTIGDYSFHTLTVPYALDDSYFLISLPFPFEQQDIARATAELFEFLLFLSAFFVALVLVFARRIGAAIITPIRKLLAATKAAGQGDLDIVLEHKPDDEMKTLVEGFNAMVKNLKRHQQELAEMSKKAAWAEMARKVAHEVKNPLTPIQLSAEHLLRVYEDGRGDFGKALKESIAYIISEVEALRKIAQEFLESSRDTVLHKEPVDIKNIVQETLTPYKRMLSERITFREVYEGPAAVCQGDRSKLKLALRNILINAIESIPGRGEVLVRVSQTQDGLALDIQDTGTGIEGDLLERIFEPSFSTKPMGAGLGLPIAKKTIEDHGGTLRIASEPGRGTRVSIVLPCPS